MKDDNWELISGSAAHEIEVLNYSNQVNVIEALFRFIMFHAPTLSGGIPLSPNERSLQELHRTGTLFLLNDPGQYRNVPVWVQDGGIIIHTPPEAVTVQAHMTDFFAKLAAQWGDWDEIDAAAYALWRINWIHPFKNGNGRTARAFSYACLCLKFQFIPPGQKTMIDLIMNNRPEFYRCLRHADVTYANTGESDLNPLREYLKDLVTQQLSSSLLESEGTDNEKSEQ